MSIAASPVAFFHSISFYSHLFRSILMEMGGAIELCDRAWGTDNQKDQNGRNSEQTEGKKKACKMKPWRRKWDESRGTQWK